MLVFVLFCFQDNSLSESFLDDSTDQPSSIDLEDFSQSSNDKSFEGAPRKKKSKTSHPFAKDLAVLKQLAGKRSNNGKTYAWLGTMVTNQMEDVDIEDRVAASLEVQRVMMKYVQKAQQKKDISSQSHYLCHKLTKLLLLKYQKILQMTLLGKRARCQLNIC